MIDMHSHILPGLDDGAKNMEETLGMVHQLHKAGFRTLLATPHVLEGKDFLCPAEILAITDRVRECVAEAGISVEILPGAENYIFPDMAKWVSAGKLQTFGKTGNFLLIELPLSEIPQYTDQVFFELQVKGVTPVLAHPERYRGLVNEVERLLDWAKRGILFQLDLRSYNGYYGPQPKQLAELMLSNELIHVIGSDAHHVARSESIYPEALRNIKEIMGESKFQEMTQSNPRSILDGKPMAGVKDYFFNKPIIKKRKHRFWNLFRG